MARDEHQPLHFLPVAAWRQSLLVICLHGDMRNLAEVTTGLPCFRVWVAMGRFSPPLRWQDFTLQVEASVIGRNCHIGRGAHITGCHLLDNVRVGDRAQISHSLLCDGVHVGAHAMIFPGSVLSYRVRA